MKRKQYSVEQIVAASLGGIRTFDGKLRFSTGEATPRPITIWSRVDSTRRLEYAFSSGVRHCRNVKRRNDPVEMVVSLIARFSEFAPSPPVGAFLESLRASLPRPTCLNEIVRSSSSQKHSIKRKNRLLAGSCVSIPSLQRRAKAKARSLSRR